MGDLQSDGSTIFSVVAGHRQTGKHGCSGCPVRITSCGERLYRKCHGLSQVVLVQGHLMQLHMGLFELWMYDESERVLFVMFMNCTIDRSAPVLIHSDQKSCFTLPHQRTPPVLVSS
jgi:hypothetical protein